MPELTVNGKVLQFVEGGLPATVLDLLRELQVEPATVVAEIDGKIVQRDGFAGTGILPGQNIELVRFVPGG